MWRCGFCGTVVQVALCFGFGWGSLASGQEAEVGDRWAAEFRQLEQEFRSSRQAFTTGTKRLPSTRDAFCLSLSLHSNTESRPVFLSDEVVLPVFWEPENGIGWRFETSSLEEMVPLIDDGVVYYGWRSRDESAGSVWYLAAFDCRSGKQRWEAPLPLQLARTTARTLSKEGGNPSPPALVIRDGELSVGGSDGASFVVCRRTGHVTIGRTGDGETPLSRRTLDEQRPQVSYQNGMMSWQAGDGVLQLPVPGSDYLAPVIADRWIYFFSVTGETQVYHLAPEPLRITENRLWPISTEAQLGETQPGETNRVSAVVLSQQVVVFATNVGLYSVFCE